MRRGKARAYIKHINVCYECIFIFYQWHGQSGKEARTHHNNGAGKVTQQQRGADRPAGTSGGGGRRGYKNGDRVLHLIPSRRKLTQAAAALRGTAVGQCCFCRRTARLPKPDTHFFRWEPWLPNGDTVPLMVSDSTIVPVIGMQNSGIFYSDTANFCLWHNSNKLEEQMKRTTMETRKRGAGTVYLLVLALILHR